MKLLKLVSEIPGDGAAPFPLSVKLRSRDDIESEGLKAKHKCIVTYI